MNDPTSSAARPFTQTQFAPWWAIAIVVVAAVATAQAPGAGPWGYLIPVVFLLLFGRLRVRVLDDAVEAAFGVGLFRKRIPFERIRKVEAREYSPMGEFWGWGIRARGSKRAWTMKGDRAVVLTLDDGTLLYLGSPAPKPLAERIRNAATAARPPG